MINNLKEAREYILFIKRTTISQVAKEINYSRPHLTDVLNGKTPCGPKLIKALKEWSAGEISL